MHSLFILAAQEAEENKIGKMAYDLGFFVGSNLWTIITVAVILLAAILYLAFFRRKKKNNWG